MPHHGNPVFPSCLSAGIPLSRKRRKKLLQTRYQIPARTGTISERTFFRTDPHRRCRRSIIHEQFVVFAYLSPAFRLQFFKISVQIPDSACGIHSARSQYVPCGSCGGRRFYGLLLFFPFVQKIHRTNSGRIFQTLETTEKRLLKSRNTPVFPSFLRFPHKSPESPRNRLPISFSSCYNTASLIIIIRKCL